MSDARPTTPQADPNRRRTVLVVEDEAALRDLYHRVFRSAGYAVLEAANGRQACRTLHQEAVDIVVTDLLMPEMDGAELIAWMRRESFALPVLMVSGANAVFKTDYLAVCRDLGAAATLEKPATADQLLAAVARLLAPATEKTLPSAA